MRVCDVRARETVYWPRITADIKRLVEGCDICNRFHDETQKEPLMSHPAPCRPWQKGGVDVFTFADRQYLITVDYLSGFFEFDRLSPTAESDIIYCLKQHFALHGLAEEVITDNSPFGAAEFARFANQYEFQHTTSSPRWPQSNGRVENAVKTVKKLMTKAREDHADPFLALLEWRNTPGHLGRSPTPTQILFGRRTKTRLPTVDTLLDTPTGSNASVARMPEITPWRLTPRRLHPKF